MDIIQKQSKLNPHSLQHILLLSLFFIFYINPCFIFNRKESKKMDNGSLQIGMAMNSLVYCIPPILQQSGRFW